MRRIPPPQSLVWEVTARCNLRCGHCYNTWTAPGQTLPEELSTDDAMRILVKVREWANPLNSLTFTGGEPLLRQDLSTLLAAGRSLFPKVQINLATNGQLLTLARATEFRSAGVNTMQLSLLSAKPETHE